MQNILGLSLHPEESDLYVPCMFTDVLNAMEAGISKLETEFTNDLPLHINESFQQSTDILKLILKYV